MTICIVSHEMAFIKDICTRVLFVDKGKIIGDETAQQVFEQSDNERIKEFFPRFCNATNITKPFFVV